MFIHEAFLILVDHSQAPGPIMLFALHIYLKAVDWFFRCFYPQYEPTNTFFRESDLRAMLHSPSLVDTIRHRPINSSQFRAHFVSVVREIAMHTDRLLPLEFLQLRATPSLFRRRNPAALASASSLFSFATLVKKQNVPNVTDIEEK